MKYDEKYRNTLFKKINLLLKNNKNVLVSLEDFFQGNYDNESLGINLLEHPGIDFFANNLKELKDRDDIYDIFIEIYEVEEDVWPFSEKIRIVTKLNLEVLEDITEELCYDEIWKEELSDISVPEGYTAYSLWWD